MPSVKHVTLLLPEMLSTLVLHPMVGPSRRAEPYNGPAVSEVHVNFHTDFHCRGIWTDLTF